MEERIINKEAIIAEYLTGEYSYRQLGNKYGIDFRKIHSWVNRYKGNIMPKKTIVNPQLEPSLPTEVKHLQAELRKAKLHAKVLEEMLKLSENLTGIELRKKFGTKQS